MPMSLPYSASEIPYPRPVLTFRAVAREVALSVAQRLAVLDAVLPSVRLTVAALELDSGVYATMPRQLVVPVPLQVMLFLDMVREKVLPGLLTLKAATSQCCPEIV